MKQKLSVTIGEEVIKLIEKTIKEGMFRNKSHAVEFSLNRTLKGKSTPQSVLEEK